MRRQTILGGPPIDTTTPQGKRCYKRLWMRAWREVPGNREHEREEQRLARKLKVLEKHGERKRGQRR